jgi:phospholipase C
MVCVSALLALEGCGTGTAPAFVPPSPPSPPSATPAPTVTLSATPTTVAVGATATVTAAATNATTVVVSNSSDATTFTLGATGGAQAVTIKRTTVYTATATGAGGTATATVTVNATGSVKQVNHVLFLMQENRTFDTYFGMLNPYRRANSFNVGDDGKTYDVDGIDDKLSTTNVNDEGTSFPLFKTTSTCLDDMTSAWLESYGQVNRFDFKTSRPILMDGFVHVAENFAKSGSGSGVFTDLIGRRAMAFYDEGFLNYYYFMASQFALSDRWFSPVSTKTVPNRIAAMSGGTTQGLVRDPALDDQLPQLGIQTIFQKLNAAGVSWKIYYSSTSDTCRVETASTCTQTPVNRFPSTTFSDFSFSGNFLFKKSALKPTCTGTTKDSGPAVGDPNNAFCIDTAKIAPVTQLFTDMTNGTLPSFSYIEPGFGDDDEHPGSGQSILIGQAESANIINALMASASWADSVFFLSYDEGGGPFDHVPPVPGHTNDFTDASLAVTTDIKSIAVNPDNFKPCVANPATLHCDLKAGEPGATAGDAAQVDGFAAQLGFRLPNMVVSPFTRKHFVSHTPMDHTAVLKFVESRFINATASLTARDAAQPDLLEFFDFGAIPWTVPPTPPAPVTDATGSKCTPANMGP